MLAITQGGRPKMSLFTVILTSTEVKGLHVEKTVFLCDFSVRLVQGHGSGIM
jgi:hypothetical protein